MQIPFWGFLGCIFLAAVWHDMASLLLRHSAPLLRAASARYITPSLPVARLFPTSPSTSLSTSSKAKAAAKAFYSSSSTTAATTAKPKMPSSTDFLAALKSRRTYYALKAESPIPDAKIQEIINEVVLHVPSSFNSQSTRVVLLLKGEHEKLWDITHDVLKAIVPAEQFPSTEQKLGAFKAGYGTVLFYTDKPTVKGMQDKFATYADRFPVWATESTAMHQLAVWAALELEGFGANLQHYNPLIDEKVAATWGIPADWELASTLVFGTPVGGPGEKSFLPLEERVRVFGA